MEYLTKYLKKDSWISILTSIIIGAFGVVLMIKPEGTLKFISYVIGILFIIIGVLKIINYIKDNGNNDFYNLDMTYGITAIILGIITIVFSKQIESFFRIILGIWVLYSSITRLSISLKLRSIKSPVWIWGAIFSIIVIGCGLYIICTPSAIIVTIGAIVLLDSILDIIENLIFMRNINNFNKM